MSLTPNKPYPGRGKSVIMSYYEIPSEVLEDRDQLCARAQRSLAVQGEKKEGAGARQRSKAKEEGGAGRRAPEADPPENGDQ